jgi:hypothetical protein
MSRPSIFTVRYATVAIVMVKLLGRE